MTPSQRKPLEEELKGAKKSITRKDRSRGYQSKPEIIQELKNIGLDMREFDILPIDDLRKMLNNMQDLMKVKWGRVERQHIINNSSSFLSNTDKRLLNVLLASDGIVSSKDLSEQLDIPLSTVQRRRKRLEAIFIQRQYALRMEKLGYRIATLYISTSKRGGSIIGKEILEMSDVVISVFTTIGESKMDLKVEVVFKTSQDLMVLIDQIKTLEGVRSIIWNESVDMIGKNNGFATTIF